MDYFKYLGPIGGLAAGAVAGWLASSHVRNEHIASQSRFIAFLQQQVADLNSKQELTNKELAQVNATSKSLRQQISAMIQPELHAALVKQLEDLRSRAGDLERKLQNLTAQPLPVIRDHATFGRTWRPYGDAGPSLVIENDYRQLPPAAVKVKIGGEEGSMILGLETEFNKSKGIKGFESFMFRNQVFYVMLMDVRSTNAEFVIGPLEALRQNVQR